VMFLAGGVVTISVQDLEAWFQERPKWLQDAARRIVQNGSLSDQDYEELMGICISEALGKDVAFSGIPDNVIERQDSTVTFRLESIEDVQGINALCPSKPLEFGKEKLCIVYGRNGAGKSGYVRLLKHACGVRQPGELLKNIFKTGEQHQEAKIVFTENGDAVKANTKSSQWVGNPLPELRGIDIYDTACGLVYVNEENEVVFEPWILRLFTELTNTCENTSRRLQEKIADQVSKKPVFPVDLSSTTAATWYFGLSAQTTSKDIDGKAAWTPENELVLANVNKRLSEINPTAKAVALRRQKDFIIELVRDLKKAHKNLSDENCITYLQAKKDLKSKRKAAEEDAQKVFSKAPLSGIGTDSWQLLWEAAQKYSEDHAYKQVAFPNVSETARCVLCQQVLDQDARDRFESFENFVRGELRDLAAKADKDLQNAAASLGDVSAQAVLVVKIEAAGITNDAERCAIRDFVGALTERREECFSAGEIAEVSTLPGNAILVYLVQFARNLSKEARSYDKDAKEQNRPLLEQQAKELAARKWLSQQRSAIEEEIERLSMINILEWAERSTNTQALSKRKSILADKLVTEAYAERFIDELKNLKASHLAVELAKTRVVVGRVYHRILLKNAKIAVKTSDILSEGEFRILSLASFLADAEGRDAKTPFIFDDPISSLDQVYEDATARRLVELSQNRQVIVFTHRLSLISSLEKYAEKLNIKPEIVCLSRYTVGEITELPIDLKRTDKAANALVNERLAAAKKAFALGDVAYENEAKGLCRDIRILIERIVETDLLAGIVRRHSAEVNTKGKLYLLAKITEDDCKFIDDYMTKYSGYEHSQSEESPMPLPKPEEIEADLGAISEFIKTLKGRAK
jgi:energy-coupling factor transporter ATP-binding protein EcfA2